MISIGIDPDMFEIGSFVLTWHGFFAFLGVVVALFMVNSFAKKKGIDVLHLNIGQPDIESPIESIKGIKENELKLLKYEYSQGSHEYRAKLSSYYSKHNINVTPEDIIVTVGASEALSFTFSAICDPGEETVS